MLREAASIPGVAILPDELDHGAFLLDVHNGTLDLRSGELRPHRQRDLLTKIAPWIMTRRRSVPGGSNS